MHFLRLKERAAHLDVRNFEGFKETKLTVTLEASYKVLNKAHAQPLFYASNLLFGDVLVIVTV